MFAGMLRTLRDRCLLTQDELAARAGMSVRQIRELESGRVGAPRASTVRILADTLQLSPADREAFQEAAQSERDRRRAGEQAEDLHQSAPHPLPPQAGAAQIVGSAPPAQLPAGVVGFTGRAEHLAALDRDRAGLAVISGVAGVGKTTLALHWANRAAASYPAGQLYVDLRGFDAGAAVEPAEVIRGFLDALGVAPERIPTDPPAQMALYRSVSAGKALLVVLDNARDADQVRPLLPAGPAARTIVTSRRRLATLIAETGASPVPLDVPGRAEAARLLTRRIGSASADTRAVTGIVDACGRLPLALALVGARARLTGFEAGALLAELRRPRGRLEALDGDHGLRGVFSWSYETLSPPAAALFRLLGLAAGPDIAVEAVVALAGRPAAQVRQALRELVDASLVAEHAPGRYQLHDLVRAYAGELAGEHDPDGERRAALTRLLDHYTHTAYQAELVLNPVRAPIPMTLGIPAEGAQAKQPIDLKAALSWLETERAVLMTTLRQAADEGRHAHAWQLSWALDTFLFERGHWQEQGAAWVVALRSAIALADDPAAAFAYRFLSAVQGRLARFDEANANIQRAVELTRATGDRPGEAESHFVLSYVCWLQGDSDGALDEARQALKQYSELDDPLWVGKASLIVGWYLSQLGDHQQALHHHQLALAAQQRAGDRANEAVTHDNLGQVYLHLGDHEAAARHYEHGLRLTRSLDHPGLQGLLLTHLGDLSAAADDLQTARQHWLEAYQLLRGLRDPFAADVGRKLRSVASTAEGPPSQAAQPEGR